MNRTADLHLHSYFSDGADSPEDIVNIALEKELSYIAITDHDTLEGIQPAVRAAQGTPLEILTGVELSTEWEGKDIHILGYCFDIYHQEFNERLAAFRQRRVLRIHDMVAKLNTLGIHDISADDVLAQTRSDAVGRPHVAALLMERGHVTNMPEAFDKFIGEGAPAYVNKFKQTPYEAIRLIRSAGGVAVMAHPMETCKDELIAGFVDAGLEGLEVYYPSATPAINRFYEGLAKKYHLVMTGGSDAHGRFRSYSPIGMVRLAEEHVVSLKNRAQQR